jgi:hypothetical protein
MKESFICNIIYKYYIYETLFLFFLKIRKKVRKSENIKNMLFFVYVFPDNNTFYIFFCCVFSDDNIIFFKYIFLFIFAEKRQKMTKNL